MAKKIKIYGELDSGTQEGILADSSQIRKRQKTVSEVLDEQKVTVTQNTETGGFDINIGDTPALQGVDGNYISDVRVGRINGSNEWDMSQNFKHIILPIDFVSGELVTIKGSANGESFIAFLSDYEPVDGESANPLKRRYVASDTIATETVPNNAKYLYIFYSSYSQNRVPQILVIGNIDILHSLKSSIFNLDKAIYNANKNITTISTTLSEHENRISGLEQNIEFATYQGYYLSGSGWKDLGTGYRYYAIASVIPNVPYSIKANGVNESHIVFLSEYNPVENTTNGFISEAYVNNSTPTKTGTVPSNAKYIYILYNSSGTDRMPASIQLGSIEYIESIRENLYNIRNLVLERHSTIQDYIPQNETLHQGYINSGKWKDINTGYRYYYVFPVTEGQAYAYRSGDYEGNIAFISDYNPVEDADAGVIEFKYSVPTDKTIKFGVVPSGAKYVYLLALSSTNRLQSFFIIDDKFILGSQVEEFDNLLKDYEQFKNAKDIFTLNGGKTAIQTKLKNLRFGKWPLDGRYADVPKCFTLLHFSDVHRDTANMERLMAFANQFPNEIQEIVFTGDLQPFRYEESVDYWGTMGFGKVLFSMGNHEVYTNNPSGYPASDIEQGTGQPQNQVISPLAYDKYIAPYLTQLGSIVQPTGIDDSSSPYYKVCYYYKDYTDYPIRIINLNSQKWDDNQKTWLISVLADSNNNNKHVIIMEHNPIVQGGGHDNMNGCTFVDLTYGVTGWNSNNTEVIDVVSNFIDNGGIFVCWLTGHVHTDNIGLVHRDARQIDLNITCASHNNLSPAAETPVDTFMQDAFNIVSIDTDSKILKVYRIGRIYDRFLQHHESCSIKYDSTDVRLLSNY